MTTEKIIETSNVNDLIYPVEKIESAYAASADDNAFDIVVYPTDHPDGYKVNSCAERYNLVDNMLFVMLRNMLVFLQIEFTEHYTITDYSQFVAKFVLKSMKGKDLGFNVGTIGNPDLVYPQISMRKSFNSRIKYAFLFGFYRLICSNGLTIAVEEMKEFNFNYIGKHTAKLSENIENLQERIDSYLVLLKTTTFLKRLKKWLLIPTLQIMAKGLKK